MKNKSLAENISDSHRIIVESLITDANTALTLLDLAERTEIPGGRSRRIEHAHRTYRKILTSLQCVSPTAKQKKNLSTDLETLKERLRAAGAPIDNR
jgi:hypothetical protein